MDTTVKIDARDVNFWYGDFHALKGISMQIEEKSVVAFIGPSGCGKSTFLRLFNRMNDLIPAIRLTGEIRIDGENIYDKGVQVDELRKNVGMVFQRPNPFPKSIFENVAYGLRVNGVKDNAFIRQRVEETLKGAALWDEVKDKLKESAYALSGGQQQRLCIAKLHHLPHIEKCRLITDTGGLLHVVRHNHNGIPFFQFMNQFFHLCRRNRVECRSRLVHQQHRRRYSHRTGDTKALLLSAG